MVKLLLDNNSPVNATDVSGYTALHHGRLRKLYAPMKQGDTDSFESNFGGTR
jgi:hypothetical protein